MTDPATRIAQIVRLLSSVHPGEQQAAVNALDRVLTSAGVSWTDFGDVVEAGMVKFLTAKKKADPEVRAAKKREAARRRRERKERAAWEAAERREAAEAAYHESVRQARERAAHEAAEQKMREAQRAPGPSDDGPPAGIEPFADLSWFAVAKMCLHDPNLADTWERNEVFLRSIVEGQWWRKELTEKQTAWLRRIVSELYPVADKVA